MMARQCVSLIKALHSLVVLQPQGDACRKLQRPEEAAAGYEEAVRHLQSCAAPSAEVRFLLLRVSCRISTVCTGVKCPLGFVWQLRRHGWSVRIAAFPAHILGHNLPASSKRL